jgi:hypothetical protein
MEDYDSISREYCHYKSKRSQLNDIISNQKNQIMNILSKRNQLVQSISSKIGFSKSSNIPINQKTSNDVIIEKQQKEFILIDNENIKLNSEINQKFIELFKQLINRKLQLIQLVLEKEQAIKDTPISSQELLYEEKLEKEVQENSYIKLEYVVNSLNQIQELEQLIEENKQLIVENKQPIIKDIQINYQNEFGKLKIEINKLETKIQTEKEKANKFLEISKQSFKDLVSFIGKLN